MTPAPRNKAAWHKRLRKVSPVFVKEGTEAVPKSVLLDRIDYVLSEPEIPKELHGVYGEDVGASTLHLCFY